MHLIVHERRDESDGVVSLTLRQEEYLFVAGGIGITPILAMIAHAEAVGVHWTLLYGGRTRAAMAFLDELAGHGDRITLTPQDEVGQLPLADLLAEPRPGTLVYACGPEPRRAPGLRARGPRTRGERLPDDLRVPRRA